MIIFNKKIESCSHRMQAYVLLCALLTLTLATASVPAVQAQNQGQWNQFRGPNGDGKSLAKDFPVEFSEKKKPALEDTDPRPGLVLTRGEGQADLADDRSHARIRAVRHLRGPRYREDRAGHQGIRCGESAVGIPGHESEHPRNPAPHCRGRTRVCSLYGRPPTSTALRSEDKVTQYGNLHGRIVIHDILAFVVVRR